MRRKLAVAYGITCYLIFLGVFLYSIGFAANFLVPKSIDSGGVGSVWQAFLIDIVLLGLFAVQHSGMARPAFKAWWTNIIPKPVERSTYVLLASLTLALIFWQWRPLPAVVWNVELEWARWGLWGLYGLGWILVYVSAELIDSDHLFGLTQIRAYMREEKLPAPEFQTPGLYRYVRHPLMVGFLIAFWVTPTMTVGHLLFSIATTGYILIALQLEERDLIRQFGDQYRRYRQRIPMLIPRPGGKLPEQTRIEMREEA